MSRVMLRDVADGDGAVFFGQMKDPAACRMAAFTAADPADRAAFERWWGRVRADGGIVKRTIVFDGAVAGHVLSYCEGGRREVCYWIGRAYWGRGVATAAMVEFLTIVGERPIYARAARDNGASIRVLEKCGFVLEAAGRGFANARGEEIEEVVMVLG